jgi:hypothetical protein
MSAVAALREPDAVLEPGGEVTAEISVLNTGSIVDQFEIDVIGAPAAWAYVEPSVMSLFPNTQQVATIRFRPPLSHDVPPGPTPFAVRVVPSNAPDHCVTEEGMLVLAPFKDVAVEMIPTSIEGRIRAKAHLAVDSRGNFPFSVLIQATDPAAALVIRARPPVLDLRPNQASFSQIYVVPRRRHIRGGVKQHRFKILVDDAGTTVASIDGTYVQPPILPKWLIALIILIFALLLWLLVLRPAIKDVASSAANSAVANQAQKANNASNAASSANAAAQAASAQAAEIKKLQQQLQATQKAQAAATANSLKKLHTQVSDLGTSTTTTSTLPKLQTISYDGTLNSVVAPGTLGSATWTIPAADTFELTDIVLSSTSTGEAGQVYIQLLASGSQPQTLVEVNLAELGTVPFETARLQTPVGFNGNDQLSLTVSCSSDQAACNVDLLYAGPLTQPTPSTTTTTTTTVAGGSSSTTSSSSSTTTSSTSSTSTTTTSIPFTSGTAPGGGADGSAVTRHQGG